MVTVIIPGRMQDDQRGKTAWLLEHKQQLKDLLIGSYGGGEAHRVAKSLLQKPIFDTNIPTNTCITQWQDDILEQVRQVVAQYNAIPPEMVIARVPTQQKIDQSSFTWTYRLHVSHCITGLDTYNLMFHGWLFDDEVMDPTTNRLGVSKWPLVGIVHSFGINPEDTLEENLSGVVGASLPKIGKLRPSDQHVHWVEELMVLDECPMDLSDWHFGSDMARFVIDNSNQINWAWVTCVDTDTMRCQLSLLIMVSPNSESFFKESVVSAFGVSELKEHLEKQALLTEALRQQLDLCLDLQ